MSVSDAEDKRLKFYVCDADSSSDRCAPSQISRQKRRLLHEPSLISNNSDGYRESTRLRLWPIKNCDGWTPRLWNLKNKRATVTKKLRQLQRLPVSDLCIKSDGYQWRASSCTACLTQLVCYTYKTTANITNSIKLISQHICFTCKSIFRSTTVKVCTVT